MHINQVRTKRDTSGNPRCGWLVYRPGEETLMVVVGQTGYGQQPLYEALGITEHAAKVDFTFYQIFQGENYTLEEMTIPVSEWNRLRWQYNV